MKRLHSILGLLCALPLGAGAAAFVHPTGSGGSISGVLTGAYSFSAGMTTVNATNVALSPGISNLLLAPPYTNFFLGNVVLVATNGSDSTGRRGDNKPFLTVTGANAAAIAGDIVKFGRGVFDVGSNVVNFKHGVTFAGEGMGVTIINGTNSEWTIHGPQFRPGSGVIRDLTFRTRDNNTTKYGFGFGNSNPQLCTNTLIDSVHFEGDTDAIYMMRADDGIPTSIKFRNCLLTSGFDIINLGGGTNALFEFEDCIGIITVSGQTNTVNVGQTARFLVTQNSDGQGATIRFKNSTFTSYDALGAYNWYDGTFGDGPYCSITWENVTATHYLTNGGTFQGWYSFMDYTNSFLNFIGHHPVSWTTSAAISTNTPGPQHVILTSGATRTNWLPPIHFVNNWTNMNGVRITVEDGAANPLFFVRAQHGATIKSLLGTFTSYTNNRIDARVTFRNQGTNWVVEDESFPLNVPDLNLISTLYPSSAQDFDFFGTVQLYGPVIDQYLTGPAVTGINGAGDRTNITIGSGLSLAADMTLSATGGGGGGLTTNANQFLGVPLSLVSGVLTTNLSSLNITNRGDMTNQGNVGIAGTTLSGGVVTANTNAHVLGTNRARWLKLDGGQTASRALVLDSSTNVVAATGTPDGTKFLRDDNTYAVPSGGSGGTNFPNVNLLVGQTNLVLSAGVRKSFYQATNANHGVSLSLASPGSGYDVLIGHTNSGATNYIVTLYSNSVAMAAFDPRSKTNVTGWPVPFGGETWKRLLWIGSGWRVLDVADVEAELAAGPGVIFTTNGLVITAHLNGVLTNLIGTVGNNVTNTTSTQLQITSGAIGLASGSILDNLRTNPGTTSTNAGWGLVTVNGTTTLTNRQASIATNATSTTVGFSDAENINIYNAWFHLTTNLVVSPTNLVTGRTLALYFATNALTYDVVITNTAANPVKWNFNVSTNGSTSFTKTNSLAARVFLTAETNGTITAEMGYYR